MPAAFLLYCEAASSFESPIVRLSSARQTWSAVLLRRVLKLAAVGLVPDLYDDYFPQQVGNVFCDLWKLFSFAKAGLQQSWDCSE